MSVENIVGSKRPAPDHAVSEEAGGDQIEIKIQFQRQIVTVRRSVNSTIADLKAEIENETGVPAQNQKLLYKQQLNDKQQLHETTLKNGSRIMVIGTKPSDMLKTDVASAKDLETWNNAPAKQIWAEDERHKKILAKEKPEEAWPGIQDKQVVLKDDQNYIPGLYNSQGTKVRLTFRTEISQLWIASAQNTQKIPYHTIARIESQVIPGDEGYSIVRIQVGQASTSNYWLYYVPSQYTAQIKIKIKGVEYLLM